MSATLSRSAARFMRVPPGVLAACALVVSMNAGFLQGQTLSAEETLYQSGLKAFQAHDYGEAEQIFRTLYLDKHDARGLMGMTEILAAQGRIEDAIKELDKAIAAEPDQQDLKLARANFFVRAQRYDEAIAAFKGLLEQQPGSADLLYRLAESYRRKGDLNMAADTFRKSSQAAPTSALPLLQLGMILETIGSLDQAKAVYEQIIKLDPNNAIALNNLAFRKAEEGDDLDSALTMAQRARQIAPNEAALLDTLGWVYFKKGLLDQALVNLGEALRKNQSSVSIRGHLAAALDQIKNAPPWMRELDIALQGDASAENDRRITELLQNIGR